VTTLQSHALDVARRIAAWPAVDAPWAANGFAGLAVLFGTLEASFPGEGWDRTAHVFLQRAVERMSNLSYLPIGMLDGVAGLGSAADLLSCGGRRYTLLLNQLDDLLSPRIASTASILVDGERIGVPFSSFDVVSGLTGVGRYLLSRRLSASRHADADRVITTLIAFLHRTDEGVPAWYTPDDDQRPDLSARRQGALNCGMAHGVAGPLALLALYRLAGVEIEDLRPTIVRLADWLAASRQDDEWGPNWPAVVRLDSAPAGPTHNAWCYGAGGIACALWLAGQAVESETHRQLALEAVDAIARRPAFARRLTLPCFCHGLAGLVQIFSRFARDTGLARFRTLAETLAEDLLAFHDPDAPFAFRSLGHDGARFDDTSLLNGSAGIALALLSVSAGPDPAWDRFFLLS
jgi:hypothetical protein